MGFSCCCSQQSSAEFALSCQVPETVTDASCVLLKQQANKSKMSGKNKVRIQAVIRQCAIGVTGANTKAPFTYEIR